MNTAVTTVSVSDDLRRLADWLDRHPEFHVEYGGSIKRLATTVAKFRAAVAALAELGDPEIVYPPDHDLVEAILTVGPIRLTVYANRSRLCVEVPTGETVPVIGWRLRDDEVVS